MLQQCGQETSTGQASTIGMTTIGMMMDGVGVVQMVGIGLQVARARRVQLGRNHGLAIGLGVTMNGVGSHGVRIMVVGLGNLGTIGMMMVINTPSHHKQKVEV